LPQEGFQGAPHVWIGAICDLYLLEQVKSFLNQRAWRVNQEARPVPWVNCTSSPPGFRSADRTLVPAGRGQAQAAPSLVPQPAKGLVRKIRRSPQRHRGKKSRSHPRLSQVVRFVGLPSFSQDIPVSRAARPEDGPCATSYNPRRALRTMPQDRSNHRDAKAQRKGRPREIRILPSRRHHPPQISYPERDSNA
jgi:hypothetical protein